MTFLTLGDLLQDVNKQDQHIYGMGISTGITGVGNVMFAIFMGRMTDASGDFAAAEMISGSLIVLAGLLAFCISPVSKKYKIT